MCETIPTLDRRFEEPRSDPRGLSAPPSASLSRQITESDITEIETSTLHCSIEFDRQLQLGSLISSKNTPFPAPPSGLISNRSRGSFFFPLERSPSQRVQHPLLSRPGRPPTPRAAGVASSRSSGTRRNHERPRDGPARQHQARNRACGAAWKHHSRKGRGRHHQDNPRAQVRAPALRAVCWNCHEVSLLWRELSCGLWIGVFPERVGVISLQCCYCVLAQISKDQRHCCRVEMRWKGR